MAKFIGWAKLPDDHPEGHKYVLVRKYSFAVPHECKCNIRTQHIVLLARPGILLVDRGYTWDGPSGPTIDSHKNLRASLAHDALYQLLRGGLLGAPGSKEWAKNRKLADQLFRKHLRDDGMGWFRATYYYLGVRMFGGKHAKA